MVIVGGLKLASKRGQGPAAGAEAAGMQGSGGESAGGHRGGRGGGPTQVSTATVQARTFTDSIEVLGVAKGRQSVTLTAATTQLVDKVRFTDGQFVPRGAILVELKNTEQDAGLAQAEARLVQAQREYDRWKALGQKGFAAKSAIDQYQSAYLSAQADVAVAKARQADRLIRAPFSGVVGLSDIAPGALVNPGAPIVTLDDVSAMRVDFQVPERYLAQLAPGQPIAAHVDAYPGVTIKGRIAQLDTRVDERTRAITARAEFPNADRRLKPGMMIRVSIARGTRQGVAAPESGLQVQGDSAFVYVLRAHGKGTTTEQRPVITGLRQDGFVEITEGLRSGEQVVADGLNKIQPGQPVRVASGPAA
ncbi:efflux transporter periplasmic adaptor subunit [Phenylobacterium hankyongense]|uniref:Efflux transporter periplasmic adaptor subunit n=2 Tax=Phenylobacterium hankyongense TaxID=1813876 RepID=A0A328B2K3_9CAUL|nr:efflux transporter periplasmic adaptor subunit [Phenylobacterium hankyongense]